MVSGDQTNNCFSKEEIGDWEETVIHIVMLDIRVSSILHKFVFEIGMDELSCLLF